MTNRVIIPSVASGAGLVIIGTSALAAGLYAPPPPPNSAYVRMIPAGGATQATVGGKKLSATAGTPSPYVVIKAGTAPIEAGAIKSSKALAAGRYYSVVLAGKQASVLEDPGMASRVKATIIFYNLTSRPGLELRTADGKMVVAAATAPGRQTSRQVNAATAAFGVFGSGAALASTAPQAINRGFSYSAIATEKGGAVKISWAKSEVK